MSTIENKRINTYTPLDVIKYKEYNDPYYYTSYNDYLERFSLLGIYKKTGMSFVEFMDLPIREANAILATFTKSNNVNIGNDDFDDMKDKLEEMMKGQMGAMDE